MYRPNILKNVRISYRYSNGKKSWLSDLKIQFELFVNYIMWCFFCRNKCA